MATIASLLIELGVKNKQANAAVKDFERKLKRSMGINTKSLKKGAKGFTNFSKIIQRTLVGGAVLLGVRRLVGGLDRLDPGPRASGLQA